MDCCGCSGYVSTRRRSQEEESEEEVAEGNEVSTCSLSVFRIVLTELPRKSCLKDNASIIHFIRTMLHQVVVAVMVTGVELVIRWNHIIDAYSLTTSAQLFPLLLSICLALWVIWHRLKQSEDDGDTDTCTTCSLDSGHRRRGNGWPAPGHVPRDWIVDNV